MVKNATSGLKYVITYHRLTGNTYFNSNFGTHNKSRFKIFFMFVSLLCFINIIYSMFASVKYYHQFNISKHQYMTSNKTQLIFNLYEIQSKFYSLLALFEFIILLMRGKHILDFLQNQDFITIDSKTERRIGFKILLFQILIPISTTASFLIINFFKNGFKNTLDYHFYSMMFFLDNIHIALISLMAYQSFCVTENIRELTENFSSLTNFQHIFTEILEIQKSMKIFDHFFNDYTMYSLFIHSFICVSNFCTLYFEPMGKLEIAVGSILQSALIIISLCIMADRIPRSFTKFINKFEELELEHFKTNKMYTDYNMIYINRLYSIREELCFTAFNLYKINTKNFYFNFITNYEFQYYINPNVCNIIFIEIRLFNFEKKSYLLTIFQ